MLSARQSEICEMKRQAAPKLSSQMTILRRNLSSTMKYCCLELNSGLDCCLPHFSKFNNSQNWFSSSKFWTNKEFFIPTKMLTRYIILSRYRMIRLKIVCVFAVLRSLDFRCVWVPPFFAKVIGGKRKLRHFTLPGGHFNRRTLWDSRFLDLITYDLNPFLCSDLYGPSST